MKTIRRIKITTLALVLMAGLFTMASCEKTDNIEITGETLKDAEIPAEIQDYVSTRFVSNTITKAVKNTDLNKVSFGVYLSGNIELEFNSLYEITSIGGTTQLPATVIPQAILDYVDQHYPNSFITEWELENNYQQVELNNEVELEFTLDGIFIRVDNDGIGDDDETTLTDDEIPAEIMGYIQTHFATGTITKAVKESDGSVVIYEIYLSGSYELEFNSLYQITSIGGTTQLPATVIPQAILDYVDQHYPNSFITEWELENNYQQVELNNEIELEFTLDGIFTRVDND